MMFVVIVKEEMFFDGQSGHLKQFCNFVFEIKPFMRSPLRFHKNMRILQFRKNCFIPEYAQYISDIFQVICGDENETLF